jgi:hypothetical protein
VPYDYVFDRALPSSEWQAARAAVVWPLAARPGQQRAGDTGSAYSRLLASWRIQAKRLGEAGWSAVCNADGSLSEKKLEYVCNCPPGGIRRNRTAFKCFRSRVCPWCYMRDAVIEAIRAVHFGLFRGLDASQRERVQLVGIRRAYRGLDWDNPPAQGWAANAVSLTLADYRANKKTALGGFARVDICPDTEPGLVVTRRSALLVMPAGQVAVPCDDGADASQVSDPYTCDEVAKLAAWCFRYPRGMMFGDAATAAQILNSLAAKRANLTQAGGLCDNAAIRASIARLRGKIPAVDASD